MARIILFTGKGGVGKTSIAAAHALKSAEEGKKSILVSADMAHNIGDIFQKRVGGEPAELAEIVTRSAAKLGVDIDSEGALEIARRARGTPRIANNLLRRVRDYAQVKAGNFITLDVARESLSLLEIDPHGLDEMDRRVLETICLKFGGGPVGLSTIAVSVGEEPDTIGEAYAPFLIMEGYLERTPKGRVATKLAWDTLGLKPAARQGELGL